MLRKILFILIFLQGYMLSAQGQAVAHKPADLQKILKASKMNYKIENLYIDIHSADYSNLLNATNIAREDSNGTMVVKKVVRAKEADSEWYYAEKAFTEDTDYKEARKHYRNVLDIDPDYYPAKIQIAKTFEKEGDLQKAESSYKQAISKNYVNYLPHQLIAEDYLKDKNYEEAVNEITLASVLNRNDTSVQADMNEIYVMGHLKYGDWAFIPQYKIIKSQKDTEIKVLIKKGWYGYAIAKATWKYEPGYAQSQGENPENLSLIQERECLMNLLAGQDSIKEKEIDPSITALADVQDYKMMDDFIYYEELLPQHPSLVYTLPNNVIKAIRDYAILAHGGEAPKKK